MKFIVDANILFSLSKPSSATNAIVSRCSPKLLAPDFALIELHKYKEILSKKSGLDFNSVVNSLKEKVIFIDSSEYSELIKKFSSKISDEKDIVYLALASKLNLPIWSNDKHFKEQSEIDVFTTAELIRLISNCELA